MAPVGKGELVKKRPRCYNPFVFIRDEFQTNRELPREV